MPADPKSDPRGANDLHPDAWARFERAVDAALKSGPKHRPRQPPQRKRKPSGSREKGTTTHLSER